MLFILICKCIVCMDGPVSGDRLSIEHWNAHYLLVSACLADNASILALKAVMLAEFLLAALGNLDNEAPVPAVAGNREVGGRGKVDRVVVLLFVLTGGGMDGLVVVAVLVGRGNPRDRAA